MEPHLPTQPPPGAPAPPPGPEAVRSRNIMKYILWTGCICTGILMILGFLVSRANKYSPQIEATNNLRQVHLALLDFDADYGSFPSMGTIADVRTKTRTTLPLGTTTSNDYFRQLIAANYTKSEKIFWAQTSATPRKPNDILGADALKKGECSFAYVAGLSMADDFMTPVVMTPVIPGTFQFDSTAFSDQAIILRIDGSVKAATIRPDTREVTVADGKTLFDPSVPHWKGKRPDLKWPE